MIRGAFSGPGAAGSASQLLPDLARVSGEVALDLHQVERPQDRARRLPLQEEAERCFDEARGIGVSGNEPIEVAAVNANPMRRELAVAVADGHGADPAGLALMIRRA